ncbi:Rha family transcriptional regulator [Vagococcus lutrae]|uniref:Rha family transcriptional regulator n=1 Tax=Vagococcus lutrae TaxID=81947 RepID=UPI00200C9BF6|nr:Rha family transcriptional regulator [Vagococcus lutrae]MCO7151715.1 Rha family transcriptional regulator [Vagococcus lutrae]UQF24242.1 Rha family transcriptional regulator [Vagococcus lutrae]UQF37779.1 Rha family transcriptional regulator [Vagococcus lutrae]UQF63668.1 Rha family transcriptional regulator [Vagococcus lutrae]
MKELVVMKNKQAVTSSLRIAEIFGKQHKDILKAIDNLEIGSEDLRHQMFYEDTYENRGKEYRQIIMNRDGFTLLAMGFTGKKAMQFKLKYIEAFNEMEEYIQVKQAQLPQSPMEILKLVFEVNEETSERVEVLEGDVKEIKENQLISTEDKNSLDRMIRRKVAIICKEQHLEQKAKSLLFSDIGKSIKELFGVPHRGRIKDKDFQAAVDFVNTWEPSSLTKTRINQLRLEL